MKIDKYLSGMYQHPDELAKVLRSQKPSRYNAMVEEILKQQAPLAAGAATQR